MPHSSNQITEIADASQAAPAARVAIGLGKRIIFACIPLLILGGLAEIGSRAYLRHRFAPYPYSLKVQALGSMTEAGYQIWQHPPNYTTWSLLSHFNGEGFRRDEELAPKKPAGVHRIFFMGGSAAFGTQPTGIYEKFSGQREYGLADTIAGWMERILRARYPRGNFQVINAATNWSKLHQQMIRYLAQIKDFEPDIIVSFDGQNDSSLRQIPQFLNGWEITEVAYHEEVLSRWEYRARPILGLSQTVYLAAMLLSGSHNVAVDQNLIAQYAGTGRPADHDSQRDAYYAENRAHMEQRVSEYVRTMRYFHEILEIDRVPHLLVLQPLISMDRTKPLTRQERAIQSYGFTHDDAGFWRENFVGRAIEEGNRLHHDGRLPFYPLMDPFSGMDAQAYTDYCHLTPAGNQVIAEKIIARLESEQPEVFQLNR